MFDMEQAQIIAGRIVQKKGKKKPFSGKEQALLEALQRAELAHKEAVAEKAIDASEALKAQQNAYRRLAGHLEKALHEWRDLGRGPQNWLGWWSKATRRPREDLFEIPEKLDHNLAELYDVARIAAANAKFYEGRDPTDRPLMAVALVLKYFWIQETGSPFVGGFVQTQNGGSLEPKGPAARLLWEAAHRIDSTYTVSMCQAVLRQETSGCEQDRTE